MNEEALERAQQLQAEGKDHDEVRRILISEGYNTEGFEERYSVAQQQAPADKEPSERSQNTMMPGSLPAMESETAAAYATRNRAVNTSVMVRNILKLLAGLLVIVAAVILLSGYGTQLKNELLGERSGELSDLTAQDLSYEANLLAFQASAQSYKKRLLDYDGLCSDIGINREVYSCYEATESYAIEAPLSTGEYYCVDSSGFAGVVEESTGGRTSCTQ